MPDAMIFRMIVRIMLILALAAPSLALAAGRTAPVATGEMAPGFTLTDQNGRSHALSAERGKRPVVLVFYRGYW